MAKPARPISGFPEFAAALKQGREIADATAAERLFQRAIGFSHEVEKVVQSGGKPTVKYTEHYPPDTTLVFWLKNRQRGRWRDKVEAEANASNDFLAELDAASERARNFSRNRG